MPIPLWFLVILVSVIFGSFCSWLAQEKGRSPLPWFLLGFLFSIVALLALIGAPERRRSAIAQPVEPMVPERQVSETIQKRLDALKAKSHGQDGPEPVKCPHCGYQNYKIKPSGECWECGKPLPNLAK